MGPQSRKVKYKLGVYTALRAVPILGLGCTLKKILHHYDLDGSLHADNPSHPGIVEADIEQVLCNPALVRSNHPRYAGQKLATGPTSGVYSYLTVPYMENDTALYAPTAFPADAGYRSEYLRLVKMKGRGALWVPAEPTT